MQQVEKTGTISIPNEAARIPEARLFVRSFLMDIEASEEDVFEILVAVEEAASNALRHGRPQGTGQIGIRCAYTPAEFIVEVIDDGRGFTYRPAKYKEMPDPLAPGGRGLYLMNRLMDSVGIASSSKGTVVTMTRELHGVDDAPTDTDHDRTYEAGSASSRLEDDLDTR